MSALSTAQEVISEGGPGKLGQAIVDEVRSRMRSPTTTRHTRPCGKRHGFNEA